MPRPTEPNVVQSIGSFAVLLRSPLKLRRQHSFVAGTATTTATKTVEQSVPRSEAVADTGRSACPKAAREHAICRQDGGTSQSLTASSAIPLAHAEDSS